MGIKFPLTACGFVCPIQTGRRNTDGPHTLYCDDVFTKAALLLLALGTDMHIDKYLHVRLLLGIQYIYSFAGQV